MSREELVFHYVWPESGAFWCWSRDAEAVVWSFGGTLAFYSEIEAVLSRLQPNGLPRFEEVLLLLSACRKNWREEHGGASRFATHIASMNAGSWGNVPVLEWKETLIEQLDRVYEAARRAGFGTPVCMEILEAAFQDFGGHLSAEDATQVTEMFREGDAAVLVRDHLMVAQLPPDPKRASLGLTETLKNLLLVLKTLPELDAEFLRRTGLPGELSPAEVNPLPFVERVRAWVQELQDEGETELAGLARIAQTLSAVVQLPRPVSEPEEMPLGGYSDIANRGNLDRLLVSELAQDPEVLAVRVALNEALYLRRESPPKQPARRRAIFIDVGIRLWGLPRVFGHGLALAFVMQCDRDADVSVVTARDGKLLDANLDSREGLTRLLGCLAPEPQPGEAVVQFLERFQDSATAADCIVITHPLAAADREFQRSLRRIPDAEFFLATVDALGNYRLAARNPAESRELQQATLDLEKLLSGGSKPMLADQLHRRDAALPLILRQVDFPLRLAFQLEFKNTVYHPEAGLAGFTKSGILVHCAHPNQGAKLLTDAFPRGVVSWREIDPVTGHAWFLIPRADRAATLITANLESGETTQITLKHGIDYVRHACRIGEMAVLVGDTFMTGHRLSDGHKLTSLECNRFRRGCGRFVRLGYVWYAIDAGLSGLMLTPVPELPGLTLELVWASPDWPAPLAMASNLDVYCLVEPAQSVSGPAAAKFSSLGGLSADGARLIVNAKPPRARVERRYFVDLGRGEVKEAQADADTRLEPGAANIIRRSQNLRNRYSAIGVTAGGGLHVRASGYKEYVLSAPSGVARLQWTKDSDPFAPEDRQFWEELAQIDPPAGARFRLQKASWADGSAAYLDQRCLLHLKSSDSSIPEVSLVMKEGMVSAWASTGEVTGNAYFVGEHPPVPPSQILGYVARFAATAARSML